MAKVKFSKTELKTQRDDLKRFSRFLPTLQLKKQQLQMEVMRVSEEISKHAKRVKEAEKSIERWVSLYGASEKHVVDEQVSIEEVKLEERNIAGVDIPVLEDVIFAAATYDLFSTSPWIDNGITTLQEVIELRISGRILERQRALLVDELRTTTQRVNLFEKVKIPECKENIRVIQIFLGDQQTAAVGRAKIAKNKIVSNDGGAA